MARADLKLLRHDDPEQRKIAIKMVARQVDKRALKQLAIMAGDDPDQEIRALAKRAGVYIRQKIGDLPTSDGEEPGEIVVSDKNKALAQQQINFAMTAQIDGDKGRMMKALEKALSYDPTLRENEFFGSLAESATGEEGDAAIEMLGNTERYNQVVQAEAEQRKQAAINQHRETVNSVTWRDVGLDAATFFAVITVGVIIVLFLNIQSAQRYVQRVAENQLAVEQARLSGRVVLTDDGLETFISTELGADQQPKTFTQMEPDPAFLAAAERTAESGIFGTLGRGLGLGVLSLAGAGLLAAVIYLLGAQVFRGDSRFPYVAHKVFTLMTSRGLALLLVLLVGTMVIYGMGGGTTIVLGGVGLVLLVTTLSLLGTVRGAFRFGLLPGLVSTMSGVILAGLLVGFGWNLLS